MSLKTTELRTAAMSPFDPATLGELQFLSAIERTEAEWLATAIRYKSECETIGDTLRRVPELQPNFRQPWEAGCYGLLSVISALRSDAFQPHGKHASSRLVVEQFMRDILSGLQSLADGWLVRLGKPLQPDHAERLFHELRMPEDWIDQFQELMDLNTEGGLTHSETEQLKCLNELNDELTRVMLRQSGVIPRL